MSILIHLLPALPPLPITRPVPPEPASDPWDVRRVRYGATYCPWVRCEYWDDAAEARSGLVGHDG